MRGGGRIDFYASRNNSGGGGKGLRWQEGSRNADSEPRDRLLIGVCDRKYDDAKESRYREDNGQQRGSGCRFPDNIQMDGFGLVVQSMHDLFLLLWLELRAVIDIDNLLIAD